MRRVRRAAGPVVLALTVVLAVTAYRGQWLAADRIAVTARFGDVIDLTTGAGVRFNDVTVGGIGQIRLATSGCPADAPCAEVELLVDPSAPVPTDVRAELAKTSVLGERYVALVPTSPDGACCLTDGTHLTETTVRSDVEALVAAGSELLVSVSSDAIRTTLETGAEAFGGRADVVASFVDDLRAVVGAYHEDRDDVLAPIDSLDRATAAYAEEAAANAATLTDLRVAARALQDQDDRLLDTLDDVSELSGEAIAFLSDHHDEIEDAVRRLRRVLEQVEASDEDVRGILAVGARCMTLLGRGAINGEAQVWTDVIMCGFNDDQGEVDEDCTPPNAGQRAPEPGYHPVPEECWQDPEPCTGRPD